MSDTAVSAPRAVRRVVVADPLDRSGLELLQASDAEVVEALDGASLPDALREADALLVRSRTRVDAELLGGAPHLRVIGRAGIGVDNIDLEAATARGILVFNVPTANLLSAAEHTFALLLALARNVPAADAALKEGRWDRKRFVGTELRRKTLGIVGLGRIGQRVASRARAFEMDVLAHDPFLSPSALERLGIEALELDDLLARADVVTLHVPLTARTRNLLGPDQLARMKPGALLVNCARGGLVDEEALLEALESGRVGGAALDVFAEEPPTDGRLVAHPRVVATPHLGAQTHEAQTRASVEAARLVLDALKGSLDVPAVNLPFHWDQRLGRGPLLLGEQLGRLAAAILEERLVGLEVGLHGIDESLRHPVTLAVARGALAGALGDSVSYVNVESTASSRGIDLARAVHPAPADYPDLIDVVARGPGGRVQLAGTLFDGVRPRVVRFGRLPLEFSPEGRLLVLRTEDVPGTVGTVGTFLGEAGINIANIHLARKDGEEDAWTVLRLDQDPDAGVLERLSALPFTRVVRSVDLGAPWSEGFRRVETADRVTDEPCPAP